MLQSPSRGPVSASQTICNGEDSVNLSSSVLAVVTDEAAELHSRFFELSAELADPDLEKELMTAKLKAFCAENAGIDYICSWERDGRPVSRVRLQVISG